MINQSATQLIDPTKQKNPIFIDEVVSQIFINRFAVYPWMTVSAKKLSYTCLPEGHGLVGIMSAVFLFWVFYIYLAEDPAVNTAKTSKFINNCVHFLSAMHLYAVKTLNLWLDNFDL